MVQFAPTGRVVPQVRDEMMNCPGLAPVSPIELMVSAAVPVLVSVKVCGALVVRRGTVPKFADVGVKLTLACTPVPVRVTTCGLVTSESLMVSVPVRTPVVVGANTMLMRQFCPGLRLVPQFEVSEKFVLHVMLLIVKVVVPTFARVTVCAALRVPTVWLPNKSDVVLRLTPLTFWVTAAVEALETKLLSPL
jgi:hypothetical protein